jgi:diguanylate cyclase (GGDEF)-like protein
VDTQQLAVDSSGQAPLTRRIVQFSSLLLVTLLITALNYGLQGRRDIVLILLAGAVCMLACIVLVKTGSPHFANVLFWSSVTVVMTAIMWRSDGLHDSALLSYPVILIGAGYVLKPRHFMVLLAALLACVVVLGLGTIYGWRVEFTPGTEWDRLTDSITILLVGGAVIGIMAHDMQNAMGKLHDEISLFHESEKKLTYLAQHDALTQLPNRSLGGELLTQAIASASRRSGSMALIFVDLDNFKDINDSLGHSAGDDFLKAVAQRLRDSVRKSDIVCRQGGDEFLIGLTNVADNDAIVATANSILSRMKAPLMLRETEILASCSLGIAVHPKDGDSFEDMLRHADLAMYQAKEAGRNTFRFFDEEINASIRENLHLISSIRQAITQREFVLHYQPVLNLKTGALVGAEALVRWQNPKLGLVSPALFIPIAEKSGLIVDIGQWVLEEACRQMRAWRDAGAATLTVAVNLSPVQFKRGNVEGIIEQALQRSGLEPQCLELEVTESTLVQDTEKFIQTLHRVKALGISISIDDFGTGYSNLSYLQRFAVDKLKIDQSFVKRLLNGPQDQAIVNAIIQMAKSMNLVTNAEGVEDDATRALLVSMGCDLAQGYFFAKPLPADQFFAWMQKAGVLPP